jgi:hypothetical protein
MRMNEIQEKIGSGKYQVDTQAVADAIIRRLLQEQNVTGSASKQAQAECS